MHLFEYQRTRKILFNAMADRATTCHRKLPAAFIFKINFKLNLFLNKLRIVWKSWFKLCDKMTYAFPDQVQVNQISSWFNLNLCWHKKAYSAVSAMHSQSLSTQKCQDESVFFPVSTLSATMRWLFPGFSHTPYRNEVITNKQKSTNRTQSALSLCLTS